MLDSSRQRIIALSTLGVTSATLAAFSFMPRRDEGDLSNSTAESIQAAIIETPSEACLGLFSDASQRREAHSLSSGASSVGAAIGSDVPGAPGLNSNDPLIEMEEGMERYDDGKIKAQGLLKNGKREGAWLHFREDGSLSQIGTYVEGVATGPWELYDELGKLSLEYEQKGDEFSYKRFNPLNGNLMVEETRVIRKDLNGDEHDDRVGRCVEYYPGGQRRCEGSYTKGKEDGLWYGWHENGKLKFQGAFLNGERSGEWSYWREDGSIDGELTGYYEGDLKH